MLQLLLARQLGETVLRHALARRVTAVFLGLDGLHALTCTAAEAVCTNLMVEHLDPENAVIILHQVQAELVLHMHHQGAELLAVEGEVRQAPQLAELLVVEGSLLVFF